MKPYTYNAIVTRVVDGDTVDVDIDLGFGIWKKNERIRLVGVDTPEKRTRNLLEKQFGYIATGIVEEFCPVGEAILVETQLDDKGKFGRVLGEIFAGGINVNQFLIENHYAVAYEGQSKTLIEEAHIENYKWLVENGKVILNEGLTFPE